MLIFYDDIGNVLNIKRPGSLSVYALQIQTHIQWLLNYLGRTTKKL